MRVGDFVLRVWRWLIQDNIYYLYWRTLDAVHPHLDCPPYRLVLADAERLPAVEDDVRDLPGDLIDGIRRGDMVCCALQGDRWVARVSATLGPRTWRIYGHEMRLDQAEAFVANLETTPTHRGCGWAPELVFRCCDALASRGVRKVFLLVDMDNTASIRVMEKCGCARAGVLITRRRFGRWHAQLALLDDTAWREPDAEAPTSR
jgi:ribosomal protein S18 acetylase RimI-like enzyme